MRSKIFVKTKLIIFTIIFFAGFNILSAVAQTGEIKGRIIDKGTLSPIIGVNVFLKALHI